MGSGSILESHAQGLLAASERCQVVAVTARHRDATDRIKKLFGTEVACCGDYKDVLARPDIDAVDILLPHDLHLPATVAAAQAGKHVMVEKVMARNVDECDRMIDACRTAGVTLSVCHDRRYQPEWKALKQILDADLMGEMYSWKLEHNQDLMLPQESWIRNRDKIGGGAIMSCLTHQLDALRWYEGEVASVACMTKTVPERMEGEVIGSVLMQMRSGALAQCSINWMASSECVPFELIHAVGRNGEAYYIAGRGAFVMLREHSERLAPFAEGEVGSHAGFTKLAVKKMRSHEGCLGEWLKMLRGEPAVFSTTGEDSRHTVELAEAAYAAAKKRCTIDLPLV